MKAVILAGGMGTRLRPLTCSRPKMLLPLGDSTLIEQLLNQLLAADISDVVLATGYGGSQLQTELGDRTSLGLTVQYSREPTPLGTAGAIKHAAPLLETREPFLVINGDIVSDIDYSQLLQYHAAEQSTTTIALYQVENTSRFGVVDITAEGRILAFIEKPEPHQAPSNLINAGCYILDHSVLDLIPSHQPVSIERDIFPSLCTSAKVMGWEHHGSWIDTGTPRAFLAAQRMRLNQPSLIKAQTHIASSARIGENVVIGQRATIGPNTQITDTVIFDDVIIGEGVRLHQALIGQGAIIGKGLHLEQYVMVGDGAIIDSGALISPGALICPNAHVKAGETPAPCQENLCDLLAS